MHLHWSRQIRSLGNPLTAASNARSSRVSATVAPNGSPGGSQAPERGTTLAAWWFAKRNGAMRISWSRTWRNSGWDATRRGSTLRPSGAWPCGPPSLPSWPTSAGPRRTTRSGFWSRRGCSPRSRVASRVSVPSTRRPWSGGCGSRASSTRPACSRTPAAWSPTCSSCTTPHPRPRTLSTSSGARGEVIRTRRLPRRGAPLPDPHTLREGVNARAIYEQGFLDVPRYRSGLAERVLRGEAIRFVERVGIGLCVVDRRAIMIGLNSSGVVNGPGHWLALEHPGLGDLLTLVFENQWAAALPAPSLERFRK